MIVKPLINSGGLLIEAGLGSTFAVSPLMVTNSDGDLTLVRDLPVTCESTVSLNAGGDAMPGSGGLVEIYSDPLFMTNAGGDVTWR